MRGELFWISDRRSCMHLSCSFLASGAWVIKTTSLFAGAVLCGSSESRAAAVREFLPACASTWIGECAISYSSTQIYFDD